MQKSKSLQCVVTLLCLFVTSASAQSDASAQPNDANLPREILQKSDQIRFPRESFQVDITVTTTAPSQPEDVHKFRVLSKGNENSVVMTTAPASERGQILLMKGRDLWVFMPEVSQPIRLSLSQRLTGQVPNGHLARANFPGDYNPTILRTDTIDSEKYYVLELLGVDRSVTYHKVLYWVQQSNFWPYKAEFYSLSERLLKTARYENFQPILGKQRPTRLVMRDALRTEEESVLEYSEMKLRDLPDKIFTKDYLKKLEQ